MVKKDETILKQLTAELLNQEDDKSVQVSEAKLRLKKFNTKRWHFWRKNV